MLICHSPTRSRPVAPSLPPEVILLIVEQLREIRTGKARVSPIGPSGLEKSWEDVVRVSRINKTWRATCSKLWQQERHLSEPRALPRLLSQIKAVPARQLILTKLYIRV